MVTKFTSDVQKRNKAFFGEFIFLLVTINLIILDLISISISKIYTKFLFYPYPEIIIMHWKLWNDVYQ